MFSTGWRVRALRTLVIVVFALLPASNYTFAQSPEASLYRVFMLNGDVLVSYGEFARVADRVVMSVPLGGSPQNVKLHLVSVPTDQVDWQRTDEYALAVRARRYAETQGEDDYTLLAARVVQALNDIHLTADPKRQLAMAQEARRNLAAWPAANYGYRAADVAQLVERLDEIVAGMGGDAGGTQFDLSLVATATPPTAALLPTPDARASLESAYRAALSAVEPDERIALLRAVEEELASAPKADAWVSPLRIRTASTLAGELNVQRAYAELSIASTDAAVARAERGDVRGLQQLIERALSTDDRLGRRRPNEMSALLAALDARLDQARRVQVAQRAWTLRVDVFRAYQRAIAEPRERLAGFRRRLEQIRARRGPSARDLQRIEIEATMALQELAKTEPPPEMQAAHGLYQAALQMTRNAASIRRKALSSKDTTTLAWDASSAAAGALMLTERAASEVNRLISASSTSPR
jgi:hypothetical protein